MKKRYGGFQFRNPVYLPFGTVSRIFMRGKETFFFPAKKLRKSCSFFSPCVDVARAILWELIFFKRDDSWALRFYSSHFFFLPSFFFFLFFKFLKLEAHLWRKKEEKNFFIFYSLQLLTELVQENFLREFNNGKRRRGKEKKNVF